MRTERERLERQTWLAQIHSALDEHREVIARAVLDTHLAYKPDLRQRLTPEARMAYLQDASMRLRFLAEALAMRRSVLFTDHLSWERVFLAHITTSMQDVLAQLECLRDVITHSLPEPLQTMAVEYVATGMQTLQSGPTELPESLPTGQPLAELAQAYTQLVVQGARQRAVELIIDAIQQGVTIRDVYKYIFRPTQYQIGRLWNKREISVAQEHYCTAVTEMLMAQVTSPPTATYTGRSLIAACVEGELHVLGLRMVTQAFEEAGWLTWYVGANTPSEGILAMVRQRRPDLVALSATMPLYLRELERVIEQLRVHSPATRTLVGGYAFQLAPDLWQIIGADGVAQDATEGVALGTWLVARSA